MTTLGLIFPPDRAPEELRHVALAADASGVDELWLWEDCFAESGLAPASVVLAWTTRLRVGVGLLPVPLRNVALTAMELATIARLFPGRLVPGVGHGVLDWMAQVGARAESPMTLLEEYTIALRALLRGETVTTAGRYVHLDDVALAWPPSVVPPLLVGGVRPKTLTLAGAHGDGVILTGDTTVEEVRDALGHVHRGAAGAAREVVVFVPVAGRPSAVEVVARLDGYVAAGATTVALLSVGDDAPPLAEFADFVGREVRPRLG
ncbi:MAG TPA: LLM class flavin-dependent oxidoreductase [Jatrophihabitans sp.]|jgi:alkanesulfonate monooxygenase SsuD/methylene tetrahydromethanopterin reductase-like flavin-dependent oxidoreductase (luciferase family)|uniref:LLM class flavin-dependent oxidoreductase n=1 Tax=Jatrophihabitans sp. TaxID=1932789 RepID=UPI002DF9986D|nr:LLM class flavin-dependent oxidoreductase [Jatrophihabitans sp.]